MDNQIIDIKEKEPTTLAVPWESIANEADNPTMFFFITKKQYEPLTYDANGKYVDYLKQE